MTQIAIHKFEDQETMSPSLLERAKVMVDAIRRRAFELFQKRNGSGGSDLDDWLQAERDVTSFVGEMKAVGLVEVPAAAAIAGD